MTTGADVLRMLRPEGGWVIEENNFDSIEFLQCEPITKAEFEAGFAQVDAYKEQQNIQALAAQAAAEAKLAALGLTADDLKALGLGSN
jgi:hypothetical protein